MLSITPCPRSNHSLVTSFDALSLCTKIQSSGKAHSGSPSSHSSALPGSSTSVGSCCNDQEVMSSASSSSHRPLNPNGRLCGSLSSLEGSSKSQVGSEQPEKRSQAAKRRERRQKLIAGDKERAVLGEAPRSINLPVFEPVPDPQTPKRKSYGLHAPASSDSTMNTSCSSPLISISAHASAAESLVSAAEIAKPRRKTRRGGKAARRRAGRGLDAQEIVVIDEGLFADNETTSPTSSARTSRSGTPIKVVVQRVSEFQNDDEDEVDALSVLESELGTPQSSRTGGSVMCVEDAVSSIDSFLSDPRNFMTIKANKLRLWQSLCIELGLVHLAGEELPDLFSSVVCVPTPPRPRETTPEPAQRFMPKKHPLPTTLTQARKILKDHGHVNLVDYLEARKYSPPAYIGAYQGLLHVSTSAMKKYTRHEGKFALKDMVRAEWLEPLMRDFGIRKLNGHV